MIDFVQGWLEARQDHTTGAWYAGVESPHHNVVNGIFKLFVTYERLGWEIPRQRAIVDFVLGGSDRERGFAGQGCSVFDPMQVLYVLRCRATDHRAAEVDAATAASFLTFLDNWDEAAGWFREGTWHGKHNLAIPLYMASLLLDHPYMRINTIYNWREGPIIERSPDGSVQVRPGIIHHTRGHPFTRLTRPSRFRRPATNGGLREGCVTAPRDECAQRHSILRTLVSVSQSRRVSASRRRNRSLSISGLILGVPGSSRYADPPLIVSLYSPGIRLIRV